MQIQRDTRISTVRRKCVAEAGATAVLRTRRSRLGFGTYQQNISRRYFLDLSSIRARYQADQFRIIHSSQSDLCNIRGRYTIHLNAIQRRHS